MKSLKIEIKWALLFILMQLAWMTMEKLAGFHDERIEQHAIVTNLVAIPSILLYVLALIEKRKKSFGGKMTYLQGLKTGLWMTLFISLLAPLSQNITSTIITPQYFENMVAYVVENGQMRQTDAEAYFNLKNYTLIVLYSTPVMGIVTTLIVVLFIKRK
jgi:hypothetical protein